MKFYLVTCKHGHVGRDKYLPLAIPIRAESMEKAIEIAKNKPGVKKDHPDWCLSKPRILSAEEYTEAKKTYHGHRYFQRRTRQNLHLFQDELVMEPNFTIHNKIKTNTKVWTKKEDLSKYKTKRIKEFNQSYTKHQGREEQE